MFVKDYMTRHPIMIEPGKRVTEVQKIMGENHIRHIPVVGDGKRLLGMVTRSRLQIPPSQLGSLNVWEITRFLSELRAENVMVKGPDLHTISPDATIEEAAALICDHKAGALPVVEDGVVVGIISETDLLIELQNLLGANEPGYRVTMRVPDVTGEASRLSQALISAGWEVMSLGSVRAPKDPSHWDLVLKVSGESSQEELLATLKAIEGQQAVDVRATSTHPD